MPYRIARRALHDFVDRQLLLIASTPFPDDLRRALAGEDVGDDELAADLARGGRRDADRPRHRGGAGAVRRLDAQRGGARGGARRREPTRGDTVGRCSAPRSSGGRSRSDRSPSPRTARRSSSRRARCATARRRAPPRRALARRQPARADPDGQRATSPRFARRRRASRSSRIATGVPQAYVLDLDGGEAERVPAPDGPVVDLAWTADGRALVLAVAEPDPYGARRDGRRAGRADVPARASTGSTASATSTSSCTCTSRRRDGGRGGSRPATSPRAIRARFPTAASRSSPTGVPTVT